MELLDGKSLSAKVKDNVKGGIASYKCMLIIKEKLVNMLG